MQVVHSGASAGSKWIGSSALVTLTPLVLYSFGGFLAAAAKDEDLPFCCCCFSLAMSAGDFDFFDPAFEEAGILQLLLVSQSEEWLTIEAAAVEGAGQQARKRQKAKAKPPYETNFFRCRYVIIIA
jgi:hypothetical protein